MYEKVHDTNHTSESYVCGKSRILSNKLFRKTKYLDYSISINFRIQQNLTMIKVKLPFQSLLRKYNAVTYPPIYKQQGVIAAWRYSRGKGLSEGGGTKP